jgi:hypothetical protein
MQTHPLPHPPLTNLIPAVHVPGVLKVPHHPPRRQMPLIREHIDSAGVAVQHHNIDEAVEIGVRLIGGEDGGGDWGGGAVREHL